MRQVREELTSGGRGGDHQRKKNTCKRKTHQKTGKMTGNKLENKICPVFVFEAFDVRTFRRIPSQRNCV